MEEVVQSISERLEPRPGRRLVLTSGDHVLEESKALWPQVSWMKHESRENQRKHTFHTWETRCVLLSLYMFSFNVPEMMIKVSW